MEADARDHEVAAVGRSLLVLDGRHPAVVLALEAVLVAEQAAVDRLLERLHLRLLEVGPARAHKPGGHTNQACEATGRCFQLDVRGGGAHQPGPGGGPVHPGHAARLLFTNGRPRGGHARGCAGPALRGGAARGARAQGATRRAGAARRRARHPEPARGAAGAAPHLLLPVRRARVRVPGEGGRFFTKNKRR